ncbi:oligosaccharide flippase family protein [Echinicola vietnamensis]|uniref:Membrane protein involved in the export of O-antigen and teichoic acid n=1 Tax=Echinicola vietnamensis (strain DSM 17526 / LMG 23754 / KMM 6221) TaxID=926556 RepID=L0FTI4_ECHVK|nr:oligosaccharide flippase family protein [Echinicola vietnamensis]AGA77224.1 membrane protein involved in the export of O-antigen and teichoic acid [Echinicola vietnamensis DSM 17526]
MIEKYITIPFSQLVRHKSVQNFIFLLIIQSSNILISLIVMPLLIQSIGVDRFGLVSLALSVILIANVFVGFGYNLSGPKDVALNQKDRKALSAILSSVISSKLVLALLASVSLLVAVKGFGLFPEYQVILLYSLLMLFSEATLPVWFFQGMEKMKLVSAANVFSKLLYLTGIVLFIQGPADAKWVNFFFGGSAVLINLLLLAYVHFQFRIALAFSSWQRIMGSLKENIYLFLSSFANHIAVNGGIVVLSFFARAEVLGMYSLAERVSLVLRIVPALIAQAIYPNAAKLYEADVQGFFRFMKKVYATTLILCGLMVSIIWILAPFIIQLLAKEPLPESVLYLRILVLVPMIASLNAGNTVLLLIANKKYLLFNASWIMLTVMLLSTVAATSLFGTVGLCVAMVMSELFVFLFTCWIILKKCPELIRGFYGNAR